MAVLTNQNGTSGVDTLTYNKAGTYHAGAGNDTIKIEGGSGVIVYTDSGHNTVNVIGGSLHTVKVAVANADSEKQTGVEKLAINGANQVDAYLGSGKDTILLRYSDGRKSSGALSQIHGGGWTDTFTIGNGAQRYQLYGDAGNDIFDITAGSGIICWGGAANDTFNVTGGTSIKLRGGDSADTYNISGNSQAVDMQLGYGNDIVNVEAGNKHTIKANLGINTINLKAGSSHVITADIDQTASRNQGYTEEQIKNGEGVGYGVDNVYIDRANQVTANLGDGRDYVQLQNTTSSKIYTEGWTDTIDINEGTLNCVIDSGAGDDIITVSGGNSNNIYGDVGNDQIIVKGGQNNIYGGIGDDTITVMAGSGNTISTDRGTVDITSDGTDTLIIYGGENNSYYTNGENDDIKINGGTNSKFYAGSGDDTITLYSGKANTLHGGRGNDTIFVEWDQVESGNIVNQTTASATDKDALYIAASVNDFKFTYSGNNLTLKDNATGKLLYINGWKNGLNTINFLDGQLVGNQIVKNSKLLVVNDQQDHYKINFQQSDGGIYYGYGIDYKSGILQHLYVINDTSSGKVDETQLIAYNNTLSIDLGGKAQTGNYSSWDIMTVAVSYGSGNSNKMNLSNTSVDIQAQFLNAYVAEGEANYNIINANNVMAERGRLYAAWGGNTDTCYNKINVSDSEFLGIVGALTIDGNASYNEVNIKNLYVYTTLYSENNINGVSITDGVAENNKVIIDEVIYSASNLNRVDVNVKGASSTNAILKDNQVDVKGIFNNLYGSSSKYGDVLGNEVYLRSGSANIVYGGYLSVKANMEDNHVYISGSALVKDSVYGGYMYRDGNFTNNSVDIINNAVIKNNVYTSFMDLEPSEEYKKKHLNDFMGTISISDNAVVEGTVYGGFGIDVININGGSVANINTNTGNDEININWGKLQGNIIIDQTTAGDTDQDRLKISGIEADYLKAALNNGIFSFEDSNGKKLQIIGWGKGFNGIYFDEGYLDEEALLSSDIGQEITIYDSNTTVNTKAGDDTVTVYGDKNTINTEKGNDIIVVEAGADGNAISAGAGDDTLTINGRYNKVLCEAGDDVVLVGVKPTEEATIYTDNNSIDLGDGNNTIYTYNAKNNTIIGGQDMDFVALFDGSDGAKVYTRAGADEIVVYGGNGHTLQGGAGNDTYAFAADCFTSLTSKGTYTLDQTGAGTNDYDCLDLSDYNSTDFTKSIDSTGIMAFNSTKYNVTINIKGWTTHAINEVQFKNQTLYYTNTGSQTTAPKALTASLLSFEGAAMVVTDNYDSRLFSEEMVQDQLKIAGSL